MKKLTLLAFVLALSAFPLIDALAVMSLDIGSEYMKVAIVKPGVPMEVVLNFESRRKTPIIVSMRNGERLFSDPAMSASVKFPQTAYLYFQDLLAKRLDNPVVKQFQERYPYFELVEDEESNSIAFKHDEETFYTPEQLLAMVIEHGKEIAENFAEQSINEVVITVPPYFNQAERRAVIRAGELAGLRVLQLMNDNTAVALNYGVFRRKFFNSTVQHYMFFDMGANSATATIVAYQEVKEKSKATGVVDKFPQLTIKGVGFDRNLGGLEIQLRLRDHLAKLFNEQKKTSNDVTQNKRSMAKLFKEAGRVKQVLSANNAHHAQIESLLDDKDFKAKVSRIELEEMCADIFERIGAVVQEALRSSEITMDEISEVILMGGSTRIPKVQEHLQAAVGRSELGKSINTDEAPALGAVYQAAHLGKGFKVKKFGVKEATLFPIQVEFERVRFNENGETETKMVKRTLFGRNNAYPQKKVMTFNKHTDDFTFYVNYGDMEYLSEEFLKGFGKTTLQEISLGGVGQAFSTHGASTDTKGVKAHFKVDESGILSIDTAEFVFEKTGAVADGADEQSTLSMLGSTISNLFGGGENPEDKESTVEESATEEAADKTGSDDAAKEKASDEQNETDSDDDGKADEADDKETKSDGSVEGEESDMEPDTEPDTEPDMEQDTTADDADQADETNTDSAEQQTTEEAQEPEVNKPDLDSAEGQQQNDTKDSSTNTTEKATKSKKKAEKPKPVTIKEELTSTVTLLDKEDPSKDAIKNSKKILRELKKVDAAKKLLEQSMNDLESFVINSRDKLYQDEYVTASTEEQREAIALVLSDASEWMYDYEGEAVAKPYQDKLKELTKVTKELWERVKERQELPRAIEGFNYIMNYSTQFLIGMVNYTGEEKGAQAFTNVEYKTLQDLIKDTLEWNKTITAEQKATPAHEKAKMTVQDIAIKYQAVDREIKYLTNKIKSFKPKPPPKKEAAANKTETADKPKSTDKTDDQSSNKKTDDSAKADDSAAEQANEADAAADSEAGEGGEPVTEEETLQLESQGMFADIMQAIFSTDDESEGEKTFDPETTTASDDSDSATHLPGEL